MKEKKFRGKKIWGKKIWEKKFWEKNFGKGISEGIKKAGIKENQ